MMLNSNYLWLFEGEVDLPSLKHQHVVVSVGFGISRTPDLNLRLPSYVIPVAHLLKEVSVDVLELYFVPHYQAKIDQAPVEVLLERTRGMIECVRTYLEVVHPDVAKQTRFLSDRDISPGSRLDEVIGKLAQILEAQHDSQIIAFAEKRGGAEALKYMASHGLFMRDPLDIGDFPSILEGATEGFDLIAMVGGPAEKIMWKCRKVILETVGRHQRWISKQYFTPIGRRPVYYHLDGEPTLTGVEGYPRDVKDLLGNLSDPDVKRDLVYLFIDSSKSRDFSLLSRWKQFLPKDRRELQMGYERLVELYTGQCCCPKAGKKEGGE